MRRTAVLQLLCVLALGAGTWPGRAEASLTAGTDSSRVDSLSAVAGHQAAPELSWMNKLRLSGNFEGDFRWMRFDDFTLPRSGSSSDLYLRMVDLAFEADLLDWVSSIVVLNSEWMGDYSHQGDERLTIDEVHFDIQSPDSLLYLVFGKRTQPFGLFENFLVTDPLTQDVYETKKVGLSLGLKGRHGLDLSVTAYKGEEQVNQFFGSGMVDSDAVPAPSEAAKQVNSFICAGSFSALQNDLYVFGAFQTEPGLRERNLSLNTGFNLTLPFLRNLVLDSEYMQALNRDIYPGLDRQFRESVLSVTAAYVFVMRKRTHRGGGSYLGRRSQIRAHPVELAGRFEYFGDDGMSAALGTWTGRNRYSLGGRYTFFEDGRLFVYLMTEYRHTVCRVPPGLRGSVARNDDEVYLRLGVDF
jgi:hypothetical protein